MSRSLVMLLAGALGASGCTTVLDVEALGRAFRSSGPPEAPVLTEEPPARLVAPEGLRATSGELRSIPLKWEPVLAGRVAGYVVERATQAEGDFARVAILPERFATSWIDRGSDLAPKVPPAKADLGDGATYYYRVRAFDDEGHLARRASAMRRATTAAVPPRPEELRTYSSWPREIALTWRAVEDPTVDGYVVTRSPSLRGEYQPIATVKGRFQTTYVDRGLGPLRVLYYKVAARNAAGGEGLPTPAERGVTKPEPLPPYRLRVASQQLGAIELAWDPNVEPNVAGYRVLRRRADAKTEEVVAVLDAARTSVVDDEVGAGETLHYSAVAFDADGLESTASDPVAVTGVGYGLEASAEREGVRLRWDPAVHAAFREARVLRLGTFGPRELARVPRPLYVDTDVKRGTTYRYVVVGVDAEGREAPASRPIEVEAR